MDEIYRENIESEYEAIEQTLDSIPEQPITKLNQLELAGLAALLQNFYNGIENILKQVFKAKNIKFPTGKSWHKALLKKSVDENIISENIAEELKEYLAFRHFFSHSYLFNLQLSPIAELIKNVVKMYKKFKEEIDKIKIL